LYDALRENQLETWVDWQDIPSSADWLAEIYSAIERADTIVFVISQTSVDSRICHLEIAHAVENNKRLIPIVLNDIDSKAVPPSLAALNWIFFRKDQEFGKAFQALLDAIETDLVWVKEHTRLQLRALEWERNGHENSYLLRGKDLDLAEQWLSRAAEKHPQPTALQTQYVLAGRRADSRRQRLAFGAVVVGLVVTVVLAILAWTQRNQAVREGHVRATAEAEANAQSYARATAQAIAMEQRDEAQQQARLALSGKLVAHGMSLLDDRYDLSLLLSIEALNTDDTFQSRGSLLTSLAHSPHIVRYLHGHRYSVGSVSFSPDGRTLAACGCAQRGPTGVTCTRSEIRLWNVERGQAIGPPLVRLTDDIGACSVALSPLDGGKTLISVGDRGSISLWDVESGESVGQYPRGHTMRVSSVAFSLDGRTVATGGCGRRGTEAEGYCSQGEIRLWNVSNRQPIGQPLAEHEGWVWSLAFSPDGQTLASGHSDIVLNDVATGQPLGQPFNIPHQGARPVSSLAFNPFDGGRTLAAGGCASRNAVHQCIGGEVHLWDVVSRQRIGQTLKGHADSISSLAFSPLDRGKTLVSGSRDRTIILWDTQTQRPIGERLEGHAATVGEMAFAPDGARLASGSSDGTIILWDLAREQSIGQSFGTQHEGFVLSLAFSPLDGGKTLASGSSDKTIRFWDVASGEPVGQPLTGHGEWVQAVVFGPDGRTLASGSRDKTVVLWNVASGEPIAQPITGHTAYMRDVALSLDGRTLASRGVDLQSVRVWDVATGQPIGEPLTGHTSSVLSVALSPDGGTLASGSCARAESKSCIQGEIRLWDVQTGRPIGQPIVGHAGGVKSLAFSSDAKVLASGGQNIFLWDVASRELLSQLLAAQFRTGPLSGVDYLAFSSDGKTLASGSLDNTVILWDVTTGQPVGQPLITQGFSLHSIAFSRDGAVLASGDANKAIALWDVTRDRPVGRPLTGHGNTVSSLAFSVDSKTLASGSWDNTVILWDLTTGQRIGQPLAGHADNLIGLAFSADGRMLTSVSQDNTINLWDVDSGQLIDQPLTGYTDQWATIAFSPGREVVASSSCKTRNSSVCTQAEIRSWDLKTGQLIGPPISFEVSKYVGLLAFGPDGKTLASGSCRKLDEFQPSGICIQGEIRLWDVTSGRPIGQALTGHTGKVTSLAFGPDGEMLASGSEEVILWDVVSGQRIGQPLTGPAESLVFSPDGKTLASGRSRAIILWDVTTRQPVGPPLTGQTRVVYSLAFSGDGRTLASGDNDGQIILWDVDTRSWQARACRIANRNLTPEEWATYLGSEPYRKTCPELP